MNKIALMVVLAVSSIAHADVRLTTPKAEKLLVLRKSRDVYAIPGLGEVRTVACTVTADGTLTARVVDGSKPWIYFYDRAGRREADCQLATKPAPVLKVDAVRIRREIATVE